MMSGVRGLGHRLIPWLALFMGFGAIYVGASTSARRPHSDRAAIAHDWDSSLLGRKVALPNKDIQGFSLPKNRGVLVLVASCTECSAWLSLAIEAAKMTPVVIVTSTKPEYVPPEYCGKPAKMLVVSDPEADLFPVDVYATAPQFYLLRPDRTIVSCPAQGETPASFSGKATL